MLKSFFKWLSSPHTSCDNMTVCFMFSHLQINLIYGVFQSVWIILLIILVIVVICNTGINQDMETQPGAGVTGTA